MADGKKSFILYCDQRGIFDQLPDDYAGKLIKHIFSYVNDEQPETDDLVLKMAFEGIKTALKRDLEKYRAYVEKQRVNGKSGGRPTKANETQKTQAFFEKPKKADSDSDSVNDSESDNESKQFRKPNLKQVQDYCTERNMKQEFAEVFLDGMNAVGWMIGKAKCRNWKSAFNTWARAKWNEQYKAIETTHSTQYAKLT